MYIEFTEPKLSSDLDNPTLTVGVYPFQVAQEAYCPVYATIEIDLNRETASSIPSAIPQEHHDDVLTAVNDLFQNRSYLFSLLAMTIHERCGYTPQEQDLIDLVNLANRYCPLGADDSYNIEGYFNVTCSSAWTAAFHFFTDMLEEGLDEEDAETERQRIADICKRLDPDYVSEG